jgi:hypothetical protein
MPARQRFASLQYHLVHGRIGQFGQCHHGWQIGTVPAAVNANQQLILTLNNRAQGIHLKDLNRVVHLEQLVHIREVVPRNHIRLRVSGFVLPRRNALPGDLLVCVGAKVFSIEDHFRNSFPLGCG